VCATHSPGVLWRKDSAISAIAVDYFAVETFFSNPVIAPVKKQPARNLPLYELKITLCGSNPAIWRRVQVPGSINLTRLHDVFQVVMGWTDSRLHQFVDAPIVYSVPSGMTTPARSGLTNGVFAWLMSRDTKRRPLFTNAILATTARMKSVWPEWGERLSAGRLWRHLGYYEILKTVKNPKHKEHPEMLDCLTGSAASLIRATSISKRSMLNFVAWEI
jgi:hypothetical protein